MNKDYIILEEANCHNCMRCVRACPTNAMTYIDNKPQIVKDDCIYCGNCYAICPHEAKKVCSDFELVKQWLKDEEVYLSVAPSFAVVFPQMKSFIQLLKHRGFKEVSETARGAAVVSKAYANLIKDGSMKNIISTCCPVVTNLVEKYYGDLCDNLAPVVSPMITHGLMIKQQHPNCKVVFLSPCIAKFKEIDDPRNKGVIDAVVSMQEILDWIECDLSEDEVGMWKEFEGDIARLYPTTGGILATLPKDSNYKYVSIEGIDRIKRMLDAMRDGTLEGYFFEASACMGSCIEGPLLQHFKHNEWLGQSMIREAVDLNATIAQGNVPLDLDITWKDACVQHTYHSEEEIQQQLIAMGKTDVSKMHDCGACGYETCRLKAVAVLDGKADPDICLPAALEKAKSLSNMILDNTPNGIVVLDTNANIVELNPAAKKLLCIGNVNPSGMPISALLPDDALLRLILSTKDDTEYIRIWYAGYGKLIDHAIVNINGQDRIVLILMDRTKENRREMQMKEMRDRTMKVTQQVIDEQMTTVQEIASILGETTARSKVALTRLKEAMEESNE